MSKRTLALIIVLTFITALLVYIAVAPKSSSPTTPYKATGPTPTPVATSRLSMNPATITTTSAVSSVDVVLDSGANKATAVQMEISYDPKLLSNVDITVPASASSFFSNPVVLVKNVDAGKGVISFAVATPPTGQAKSGKGPVATITFRTNTSLSGTTSLVFSPKTIVTAEGIGTSVLKESIGTTIFVQQTQNAPTTAPIIPSSPPTQ